MIGEEGGILMSAPDLLATKFTVPPVRSTLLPRSHLIAILDQSRSVPLTLVSASAGFGKTTLLSSWANQSACKVAWLSLDEQDSDPARFWIYVIAALRHGGAPLGEAASAILHAPQSPQLTVALTALINDLAAQTQDIVLILDDYHMIGEPAIHSSLQFLLDHMPPCLHVILASRADPPLALARLRARDQVIEIRETDLRLREEEGASFLTQIMRLDLSGDEIGRLETRTEGWIAGLQLAALALRRHADVSAFLQTFAGSHRLILDYVQEEILDPLPEGQRRFLLYTSILTRMNAEICRAITGEPDSQQMLEAIERAHLFLVPLDEERRWYRWHTLFREVLLVRLQATQPDQVPRLHREAALWYQRQEWPHEAIPHALAARDFALMADFLESYTERLFLQGELKTLLDWIKLIPPDILRTHPRLATNYILAFDLLFPFSQQQQAEQEYLQHLRENVEALVHGDDQPGLPPAERELLRQRLMILDAWGQGAKALSDGNIERMSSAIERIQCLPLDDNAVWQQHSQGYLGMAYRLAGDFPSMIAVIQEFRKIPWIAQHRYLDAQAHWGFIVALIALGRLREANEQCQELQRSIAALGGPLPLAAYPDLFQAQLAYAWNQLEVAKSAARQAIAKTTAMQYMDTLMGGYEVLVHAHIASGDLDEARHTLREMEQLHQSTGIPIFDSWVEALRVYLWLAQGQLAKAADWADHAPYRKDTLFFSSEITYLALVRVYLAQRRYPEAMQWIEALLAGAERVARTGSVLAIEALRVIALQASGATQDALVALSRLLTLTEPEGYIRVFLDAGDPMQQALQTWSAAERGRQDISPALLSFAQTVLGAFTGKPRQTAMENPTPSGATSRQHTSAQSVSPLPEPLTPREQEVLLLLAEGASNQEIANHLVVSLATAKKHVAGILSKLGAANRTQAIARARTLSLI
jgi:LuxR family transcriptional regulator, maltose regulon positive regulatory protein